MNKSGRNKIKQRSAVSRKLLMQYVISIIGYVVGVMKHFLFGNSSDGQTDKKNTRTD